MAKEIFGKRVITCESVYSADEAEKERLLSRLSDEEKAEAQRVLKAEVPIEVAIGICRKILKNHPELDSLRFILAQFLFCEGSLDEAEELVKEVWERSPKDPEILTELGKIYHARGEYQKAISVLKGAEKAEKYIPFYGTTYGDCLEIMGQTSKARESFHRELEYYKNSGKIVSAKMLDGAFQRCLYLDVDLCHRDLKADIELYKKFLSEIEMTEFLKECLCSTIVNLSLKLHRKWFRPIFLDLVGFVDKKGFLDDAPYHVSVSSAYTSEESYRYHEDERIGKLLELVLIHSDAPQSMEDAKESPEEMRIFALEEAKEEYREYLSFLYYLCVEYDSQKRSIDILRTDYPKTYASWLPVFTQLENETSRAELAEDCLKKYWDIMEKPVELEELRSSMQREAKKYSEEKKDTRPAANVDYEQTVRRTGRKIMPNDPCPCGSGKKYKKCCGR